MSRLVLLNLPIGNPQDLTLRVLEKLKSSDYLLCEDTRSLKAFLKFHGVDYSEKTIDSFHDQSPESKIKKIIDLIKNNREVCYLSEAGSPVISDPAYPLVKACWEEGIEWDSYSGISSVVMSLELSGLPPIPFSFQGFVPREKSKRRRCFEELPYGTHLFFESPKRLESSLEELASVYPETTIVVVKELSKKFQKVYRFTASEFSDAGIDYRGEFVLLIHLEKSNDESPKDLKLLAEKVLSKGGRTKELSQLLSSILKKDQGELYKELSSFKKG